MISFPYYTKHLDEKKDWKCFLGWIYKLHLMDL